MNIEEALKLAINVLNQIPNTKVNQGTTYEVLHELDKVLEESVKPRWDTKFGSSWTLNDIGNQADSLGFIITLENAIEISEIIENKEDANSGINWDLINNAIIRYCRLNKIDND